MYSDFVISSGSGKSPCKDCEDRLLGCHSVCDRYLDYTKSLEKDREQRLIQSDITSTIMQGVDRAERRRNLKSKYKRNPRL